MPRLVIIEGEKEGHTHDLGSETIFLGRSSKNDLQIRDTAVSRKQLKIYPIGKRYFVEDLKSTNGTFINGKSITPGEGYEVNEGDTIEIGDTVIRLEEFSKTKPGEKDQTNFMGFREQGSDSAKEERRSRSQRDLELIYKVSELIKSDIGLAEFIDRLLDYILDALPRIDQVVFILFDAASDQKGEIKEVMAKSRQGKKVDGMTYKKKIVERVVRDGKAVRMSNTAYESPQDYDSTMIRFGSIMCVPIISNLKMRGVIYIDSFSGAYAFRKDDLFLLNSLSGSVAGAVEKEILSSQLKNDSDSK
jgi:pSer/pThr/pTyr-binding forkhead associated (FHA) protein